jgi:large subunit ribosomal protein L13
VETASKLAKPKLKPEEKPAQKLIPVNKIATIEFDASGLVLGRLATKIADSLRGKRKPSFRPYLSMGDKVVVQNAAKIVLTGNKLEQKKYYHHTGYLGHLKTITAKELMIKDPGDILKRAVYGMLPKNKLRDGWMKNLTINN